MTERSAAEWPPASLHDLHEPGRSRSNTRTGRDRACIETGGHVTRHHYQAISISFGGGSVRPLLNSINYLVSKKRTLPQIGPQQNFCKTLPTTPPLSLASSPPTRLRIWGSGVRISSGAPRLSSS